MIRALAILWSLCALGVAAPAAAQLAPTYSGYSSAPREDARADYWNFMDRIGSCLANQKPDQSRAFVHAPINSDEEAAAFDMLFNRDRNRRNNCMGSYTGVSGGLRAHYRGSVAEGLFEKLDDAVIADFIESPPEAPNAITNLHELARCFVVANPSTTVEFLRRTDMATDGELEFIMEHVEAIAPCMPAGRELNLEPTDLRMAFAEAAYRAASGLDVPEMGGRD